MFFYSMTINKLQSYLLIQEFLAQEYANQMVEVIKSLIIRIEN